MKKITLNQVLIWLKSHDIEYEVYNTNHTFDSYTIASLFEPIENGFYFFTGSLIPEKIVKSIVLVAQDYKIESSPNIIITVSKDPQMIYYQILGNLFGNSSSGKVSSTAVIHPEAIIGKNVQIDHFTVIGKCRIGDNTIISSHCVVHDNTIIGDNVRIETQSVIGTTGVAWTWNEDQTEKVIQPQLGGVTIGANSFLGAQTVVVRGSLNENTQIGKNCLLAPGSRIGHGTRIGDYVHFANSVITGGNTNIGNYCFVGSAAIFRPKVKVHQNTIVGAGALVIKNTSKAGLTLMGVPAKEFETKKNPNGMPKPKLN